MKSAQVYLTTVYTCLSTCLTPIQPPTHLLSLTLLPIYLPNHLPTYPSAYIYLPNHLPYLLTLLPIHLPTHPSAYIYLPNHLPTHPSAQPPTYSPYIYLSSYLVPTYLPIPIIQSPNLQAFAENKTTTMSQLVLQLQNFCQ